MREKLKREIRPLLDRTKKEEKDKEEQKQQEEDSGLGGGTSGARGLSQGPNAKQPDLSDLMRRNMLDNAAVLNNDDRTTVPSGYQPSVGQRGLGSSHGRQGSSREGGGGLGPNMSRSALVNSGNAVLGGGINNLPNSNGMNLGASGAGMAYGVSSLERELISGTP